MNKNLKKVISAVAALSMSASSIAVLAVDFPDVDASASYAQAVKELSALNIISGYEDGTFRPDNQVTRAEISKMIVDALGESAQATSASGVDTQFSDVTGAHWAAGYVATGVADGFISGMGDGTFAPDDNVTFVQAQSMLVRAIGYQTYAEGAGGWPNGYKRYAATNGITDGVSANDGDALTRAQVAQMINNAMEAPVCVISSYEPDAWGVMQPVLYILEDEDYESLFTKKHNAYKVYGRVEGTSKTAGLEAGKVYFKVEKADNFDDTYVTVNDDRDADEMYVGDSGADQYLKTYAEALIQKNDDDEYTILSITPAAANKSITLAAEDFIEDDSTETKLYFRPAGATRGSNKYDIADEVTIYVNGVEDEYMTVDGVADANGDYDDTSVKGYLLNHKTASVTLQKVTNPGSTNSSTKYSVIMISSYATAVVDDVVEKSTTTAINFKDSSNGKSKLTIEKEDETYTYSFTLDGEEIAVEDLQENDVLSISYNSVEGWDNSRFFDVIVTRNFVEGVRCSGVNSKGDEYTIGGEKYAIADGMALSIDPSTTYNLYLDHFGNIAAADVNSVNKNYGILKNIYKKAGGDYIAQVINKEGVEVEYKVDDKNVDTYKAYLTTYDASENSADYTGANETKLDMYPEQVIEYTVASSTNKITIKNSVDENGAIQQLKKVESTGDFKASASKIGSIKVSDATVIIDISNVNNKDEYKVVTVDTLTDGEEYTVVGYDKSSSDSTYRFVLITDGLGGVGPTTELAIFLGEEIVEDANDNGSEKTAYNFAADNDEGYVQLILDDTVTGEDDYEEGDVLLYATNAAGYITEIHPVFADTAMLDSESYESFSAAVMANDGAGILAATDFATLLSSDREDVDVVFGPVVNKVGDTYTIGTALNSGKVDFNDANNVEVTMTSDSKIYTYDFSIGSSFSRVLVDDGMLYTPSTKSAFDKDANGDLTDVLDLTNDNVKEDVVFAVVRTNDDDVQEIYLITDNN